TGQSSADGHRRVLPRVAGRGTEGPISHRATRLPPWHAGQLLTESQYISLRFITFARIATRRAFAHQRSQAVPAASGAPINSTTSRAPAIQAGSQPPAWIKTWDSVLQIRKKWRTSADSPATIADHVAEGLRFPQGPGANPTAFTWTVMQDP